MASDWTVRDTDSGNERKVASRSAAEDKKAELERTLDMDVEIVPPESAQPDGGEVSRSSSEPRSDGGTQVVEASAPEEIQRGSIDEDPIEWVPEHFVDTIEGVPTINRKGYCVLAERFGVSVTAEPVTLPSDTGFEYAEFRAIATTEDGQEYSGFGSAHLGRGDDAHLLGELAETRALKRATTWATGVGITALEELQAGQGGETA